MKNLLVVVLVVALTYKGYTEYTHKNNGAFDEYGNPLALLFTIDQCGMPCNDVRKMLDNRNVDYEEIVVTAGEEQKSRWEQFGAVKAAPYLVVGNERVVGSDMLNIIFTVGTVLGDGHLKQIEADILHKNFTADGKPKLVMYTMDGCGYCESAAKYFLSEGISYEERNTSVDPVASKELDALRAGTPVIFYGHTVFVGWGDKVCDSLLELL